LVGNNALDQFPEWKEWYALIKDLNVRYVQEHPRNTNPLFVYARFLEAFSRQFPENIPEAETYYLKALETSPSRQQIMYSLGRFYIQLGKKQEGLNMFQRAVNVDPDLGESHWFLGLSLVYDQNQVLEGSKEIVKAETSPAPYVLKDVREATALAYAYDVLHDTKGLIYVMEQLPGLQGGSTELYLAIVRLLEKNNMIAERDRMLGAMKRFDETIAPRLVPLENGSATSIDASFNLTQNLVKTPTLAPIEKTTSTTNGIRIRK
jgi:tetratricopeptide (TPR) repeat protein